MMNEIETCHHLRGLIENQRPFCHVRFGDGDVMFATGVGAKLTADGEEWSPALQQRMIKAWFSLAQADVNLLVGDVESYDVSDGVDAEWRVLLQAARWWRGSSIPLVHMEALRCSREWASRVYEAIRDDPRQKVYVAPARLRNVANWLRADILSIPLHVAHEEATNVMSELLRQPPEVLLLSAGRGGKLIQSYVAAAMPSVTQIDIGSGLDLLIDDGVRRGTDARVNRAKVLAEYRELGWAG